MAYLDKDAYFGKQLYAERKMAENAEIGTLTEEQHEVLAELCRIRHEFHSTDSDKYFNSESQYNLEEVFSPKGDSIYSQLEEVDLPSLSELDFDELPSSSEWEWLDEDKQQEWENKAEELNKKETGHFIYTGYELWREEVMENFDKSLSDYNEVIEDYLRKIDEKYGTEYCPTGIARNREILGDGYIKFESQIENEIAFNIKDEVLVDYLGDNRNITIPDSVTKIGEGAFHYCESLESVVIPDSVTEIGEGAFYGCESLKSVTIPDSVTEIGEGAFHYCESLESVVIPDSVTEIGEGAFKFCKSLESVVIPDSVTEIGEGAFEFCESLKSVTIPDSVTEIGRVAFYGCESLESVVIPDSVTEIGEGAFEFCESLKSVTIPDSVTEIGEGAFHYCESLESVVIPDSVTEIGEGAFEGCKSLKSVVIPDSVTEIGEGAFEFCESLKSVTIPDSVTEIGRVAFHGCESLESVVIPDSVTEIGEGAFFGCPCENKVNKILSDKNKEKDNLKKIINSETIEGLTYVMYINDGSGAAMLNGETIGEVDLATKEIKIGNDSWTPMPYESVDDIKKIFMKTCEEKAVEMGANYLYKNSDPYDYDDQVDNREDNVRMIAEDIRNGNTSKLMRGLNDIIENEDTSIEDCNVAKKIVDGLIKEQEKMREREHEKKNNLLKDVKLEEIPTIGELMDKKNKYQALVDSSSKENKQIFENMIDEIDKALEILYGTQDQLHDDPDFDIKQALEKTSIMDSINYLKNAEMAIEDDYNSIDGIINNGKKEWLEDKEKDNSKEQPKRTLMSRKKLNETAKNIVKSEHSKSKDLTKEEKNRQPER